MKAGGVPPPRAILFDVFGTLVTYQPDLGRLAYPQTHQAAGALGFEGTHDEFVAAWDASSARLEVAAAATCVEFSMTDAARAFGEWCGLAIDGDDARELGSSFVAEWQVHVVPVSGAAEMLHRVAGRCRLGVVSNTHDPAMVPGLLRAMGVRGCFGTMVLSVEHGFCKPHRTSYERALGDLYVAPGEAWFVGDSYEADYRAPTELGMRGLLIGPYEGVPVAPGDRLTAVTDVEAMLPETL